MIHEHVFYQRNSMTNLAKRTAEKLKENNSLLVSNYDIFLIIWKIYQFREAKYLRGEYPSQQIFRRTRSILREENIIKSDNDYTSFWRVLALGNEPADTLVCQADPYCYISHLSAMQKYGLTNRRPEVLFITTLSNVKARVENQIRIQNEIVSSLKSDEIYIEPLRVTHHPTSVRKRKISVLKSSDHGDTRIVKGTSQRIASIGQTFLNMLENPERCGGMRHILDIWKENGHKYLKQIIKAVENSSKPILKVRAGYILNEYMGYQDPQILQWSRYAQRGGSRVLEKGRPYTEPFSEKWMISLNVG